QTQRLDESTGPLTVLQHAVKPEESRDDVESIILHQSQKMIDPYTKLEITNPVINIKCKHLYERDVILPFLARNEKRRKITRCFHVGCNHELSTADFIPFKK
uniref:E3 SUMO-protein ligase NSE2 n=1 Tax=Romanomermis culicivorax TaxID=13658 RepID=A0A915IQA9_ROMCU